MKTNTIRRVIATKIDEWLGSITDDEVRKAASKDVIVTGGCIASMLLGERVNDFDIYFRRKETVKALAKYYLAQFMWENSDKFEDDQGDDILRAWIEEKDDRVWIMIKSAVVLSESKTNGYRYFGLKNPDNSMMDYVEKAAEAINEEKCTGKPYRPVFLTYNAITLSNKIQIVTRFYGSPEEIHKNYDFIHATNYWTPDEGLVLNKKALASLLTKELQYVGSLYPFCSLVRTNKFIRRGWSINAGQYLKMALQLSKLDLRDRDVLEDQLIGVYTTHFFEIIKLLKEKREKEGKDKRIDSTYLMEIIDRIF